MLYNALKVVDERPQPLVDSQLSDFSNEELLAFWASYYLYISFLWPASKINITSFSLSILQINL
jgi:hypothetical protein